MVSNPTLGTRFSRQFHVVRKESPPDEDPMRRATPFIVATGKRASTDSSVSLKRAWWVPAGKMRRRLG